MAFSLGACSGAVYAVPVVQGMSAPLSQTAFPMMGGVSVPTALHPQQLLLQFPTPQTHLLQQIHLQQCQMLRLGGLPQRTPSALELAAAVESLYLDGLRPYGRILRKRLLELTETLGFGMAEVDLKALKAACEACPYLVVEEPEGAADWSVLLPTRPQTFVDVYSSDDVYPEEMWARAARYFSGLPAGTSLPGGRFACAQLMVRQRIPFLAGYSLGQVCHIVQLAISQRKLLGYSKGTLVPYHRSESKRKDQSAMNQHPCPGKNSGRNALVTWDSLRGCIRELFALSPARSPRIPLSNIKRVFRSQFQLELSETSLGYAKLSELFSDPRLEDICAATQCTFGYVIVPAPGGGGRWLADADGEARGSAAPRRVVPLSMDLIEATSEPAARQRAASAEPSPPSLPTLLGSTRSPPFCPEGPKAAIPRKPGPSPLAALLGARLSVRNTFIHYASPPPTPLTAHARVRAQSLPRER